MIITDATNLPRLIQCNGSRLLQADPVFAESDNTVREEGNAAHWLASVAFTGDYTVEEMVDRKAPNGIYITAEMAEHVSDYLSCIDRSPRTVYMTMEKSYSIVNSNWQINGRSDFVGWDHVDGLLNIDDFKYGYMIVEPENNWTLISHAVGFCIELQIVPQQITFTIHQPRAAHRNGRVRHVTITYAKLLELYAELNAKLSNPSNMLQTGPHCYRCSSFLSCVARQDAELNAIEVSRTAYQAGIDNVDLADRLNEIHRAMELLKQSNKAYEELAAHRIVKGEIIANHAVENELTNRVWKDGTTPELMLALTGKDIAKKQLPTPRQAEQAGIPLEIVAMFSERRSKGTKLVRIDANKKAVRMFGNK